jgi:tetratricopeptide (TPR) repeat protein
MYKSLFLVLLVIGFVSPAIRAQSGRDRDEFGNHDSIQVTVFGPGGRTISTGVRVTLRSEFGLEQRCNTDDLGVCLFEGLSNGAYTITVEGGEDFTDVTQSERIDRPRLGVPEQRRTIIRLLDRRPNGDKTGVVRAENANVPKEALDHYDKAIALSKTGDVKGAIAELKSALARYPAFLVALTELGVQQLRSGQLAEADASFAAALKIKPGFYEALVNRGIGLFRQAKLADAEVALNAAINANSSSAVAHFYLGRAMMGRSALDDAEKELNTTITLSGDKMPEAHRMLTQIFIQKSQYDKALKELNAYLAANPKAPDDEHLRKVHKQLEDAVAATSAPKKP